MPMQQRDVDYWLWKEGQILEELVDCVGWGFPAVEEECLLRSGVVEALIRARSHLPAGCNFKLYCGWRSRQRQEELSAEIEERLRKAHPDWDDARTAEEVQRLAPRSRLLPGFGWHRYGGAADLTVTDPSGQELDMGVPVYYVEGRETQLLFYELKPDLSVEEERYRDNRRILVKSMAAAGFEPYLSEFWHWRYHRDLLT